MRGDRMRSSRASARMATPSCSVPTWAAAGGTVVSPEMAQAISIDAQGNAYVAGVTGSTNFPRLNALQASIHGLSDAFVS